MPRSIFIASITPRKVQVDGPDDVFGTYTVCPNRCAAKVAAITGGRIGLPVPVRPGGTEPDSFPKNEEILGMSHNTILHRYDARPVQGLEVGG